MCRWGGFFVWYIFFVQVNGRVVRTFHWPDSTRYFLLNLAGKTPARFSPDDKYSRQRIICKRRFGLLLTQQAPPALWKSNQQEATTSTWFFFFFFFFFFFGFDFFFFLLLKIEISVHFGAVRADAFGHLALAPGADEIDLDGDRRAAVELVLLRQVEPQLRQHPRVAAPPVERPQQVLLSALAKKNSKDP
jgi:hypothetical protein